MNDRIADNQRVATWWGCWQERRDFTICKFWRHKSGLSQAACPSMQTEQAMVGLLEKLVANNYYYSVSGDPDKPLNHMCSIGRYDDDGNPDDGFKLRFGHGDTPMAAVYNAVLAHLKTKGDTK